MKINLPIKNATELVTPREKTRAGFVALALEKNYLAVPYVEAAKSLKTIASKVKEPKALINVAELRMGLLTASGLSEKSLSHLTEEDKTIAIKGLIENFLDPAGDNFVDELVYRYLLTNGDSLGGKARNLAGTLGERKFLRSLLSLFHLSGIDYQWQDSETNKWLSRINDDGTIEKRIKGVAWNNASGNRLLIMNMTVPLVKKNVDLSILDGTADELIKGKRSIIYHNERYIALGELKGGIDPAGADEHWKTANSALERIRSSFRKKKLKPKTFFIGAAIENSMASEIFRHLKNKTLHHAANLTNDEQLTSVCNWIINL
ncbi:MAG: restriction endonuclease [Bacteroidetes bacterium]|nr:MAG: restriction endonuclease [Bacteroidota bacterium]